ncbi:DUF536 domain-containing protein [Enterococcus wangshanyuanii]|uniref:Regulator of chromosome segregation-like C-terminal domain-containing protein n=1 Tax=Enterococcus wangshanyuanii TaxID=2005703 RepID=A0ABQ1PWB8_9ENTE|nr:DUF536 domain-containing protein [Enterococcus wangshanyuanii]GGD05349.1 hypothetical protein GCM10011573_38540 [Enterococcus wangshanyuanii]
MADKTIKELADELGISKSYVDKIIRTLKLNTKLNKVGNKYVISKKQENLIKSKLSTDKTTTKSHTNSTTNSHTEVDFLREQLRVKNEEMNTMQRLLDQQQQLTLQSNKRIEQLEAQLQIGSETPEEKQSSAEEQPVPDPVPDKKWWHFLRRDS